MSDHDIDKGSSWGLKPDASFRAPDEKLYMQGRKPTPSDGDFPEDERASVKIAQAHAFLPFFARYQKIGAVMRRSVIMLSVSGSKHFAGRVENDGGFALGAYMDDMVALASLPWQAGRIVRKIAAATHDHLVLVTKPLDDDGGRVQLIFPMSARFVDAVGQACVNTGRDLPASIRIRAIKAMPGRIAAQTGRPSVEVPLSLVGFGSFVPEGEAAEIAEEAPEPSMVPLFGATVSSALPRPTANDLDVAFKAGAALVGTLAPVGDKPKGPSLLRHPDDDMDKRESKLVHNPKFQPTPLPMRR